MPSGTDGNLTVESALTSFTINSPITNALPYQTSKAMTDREITLRPSIEIFGMGQDWSKESIQRDKSIKPSLGDTRLAIIEVTGHSDVKVKKASKWRVFRTIFASTRRAK
jgi:hypothetical protein